MKVKIRRRQVHIQNGLEYFILLHAGEGLLFVCLVGDEAKRFMPMGSVIL